MQESMKKVTGNACSFYFQIILVFYVCSFLLQNKEELDFTCVHIFIIQRGECTFLQMSLCGPTVQYQILNDLDKG